MQPTEMQVERSLAALRAGAIGGSGAGDPIVVSEVPPAVHEALASAPELRLERLEEVRRRLDGGQQPTDEELAGRMVGRIVCDRLR